MGVQDLRNICKIISKIGTKISDEKKWYICYIIIIILVLLYNIHILKDPYFTDEIGYWAAGALFSGHDWSGVISYLPYYGYGYGIFLALFFGLHDSVKMFHGAVLLNIVFVIGIFFNNNFILKILFINMSSQKRTMIAFASSMYASNIVYAHMTLCEVCLTFFFSLMVLVVCRICQKVNIKGIMGLSILLAFLTAIHLRALVLVIAALILFVFMSVSKRWNIKYLICFGLCLISLMAAVFFIKNYIINNLYTNQETLSYISYNDNIPVQLSRLQGIFQLKWWMGFFKSVIEKVFYLSLSSYFVFDFAIFYIILFLLNIKIKTEFESYNYPIYFFLFVAALGIIFFDGLVAGNVRIDQLLYGRYMENIMPVFLSIGLAYLSDIRTNIAKILFLFMAVSLLASSICHTHMANIGLVGEEAEAKVQPLQITGLAGLPGIKQVDKYIGFTLYAVLIIIALSVILYFLRRKNWKIFILSLSLFWIVGGYKALDNFAYNFNYTQNNKELTRIQDFIEIKETADQIENMWTDKVYYLLEDGMKNSSYYQMYSLQYDLVDIPLIVVLNNNIDAKLEKGILVVHHSNSGFLEVNSKYELLYENGKYSIFNIK